MIDTLREFRVLAGSVCLPLMIVCGLASAQPPAKKSPNGFKPLPAPAQPANVVKLTPIQQLGKNIFFDEKLSTPVGYSCATCHIPATGFTGPSSDVNQVAGPVPGVISGRFGKRKPQAVSYSAFSPVGPFYNADIDVWMGGNFWDGRATSNATQARMPFLDPNEMANSSVGPMPPHAGGFSAIVASRLSVRPYTPLFKTVFGAHVFQTMSDADIYSLATFAIAAFEASAEVNQFSSKFDASKYGTPPSNRYKFTASEVRGHDLFFGKAQCSACHTSSTLDPVLALTGGRDAFSMYCYANIGVPRNPGNPFYAMTDRAHNPFGCNPDGAFFIDLGLAGNPNPTPSGARFMNQRPGDIVDFRGLFKAPSVRNVDKRPSPDFVKSFMHNGVFKSLPQVVHFYNKRNIAVNSIGHELSFDLRVGPPRGYFPLFPPPEILDNVQNAAGLSPADANDDVATNGQVGNLGLSPQEEADIVNFLKALTDGFVKPTY